MKTVCKSILIALILSWFGTSSTREDDLYQDAEEAIVLAHITDSVYLGSAKMTAYYFAYPSKAPRGKEMMLSGTITNGESVTLQEAALALGTNVNTLNTRIRKAKSVLQANLKGWYFDEED